MHDSPTVINCTSDWQKKRRLLVLIICAKNPYEVLNNCSNCRVIPVLKFLNESFGRLVWLLWEDTRFGFLEKPCCCLFSLEYCCFWHIKIGYGRNKWEIIKTVCKGMSSRQLRLWMKPVSWELDKDQAEIVYTLVGGESNKRVAKHEPARKRY